MSRTSFRRHCWIWWTHFHEQKSKVLFANIAQRPDPKYQKQMLEASFINKPNGFDSQKYPHVT
jgi:hypothetical protein